MTPAFLKLHDTFWQAGIPVAVIEGMDGAAVIKYGPEATPAQRSQGETILAGFDWAAPAQAEAQAAINATALDANIAGAFAELRAFRDRTATTLTTAQNIAILKTICRVLIWVGRLLLKRLDATS